MGDFEFKPELQQKIEKSVQKQLQIRLKTVLSDTSRLKKRISELQSQKEALEMKHVFQNLPLTLFEKYTAKIDAEISEINKELLESDFDSSNLQTALKKALEISRNLSEMWDSSDYKTRQKLQSLIFPEGILYNKEKHLVRTQKTNSIFQQIADSARGLAQNKSGNSNMNCHFSDSVPRTGIEPARSCERQILSLLRLPIPPPGPG